MCCHQLEKSEAVCVSVVSLQVQTMLPACHEQPVRGAITLREETTSINASSNRLHVILLIEHCMLTGSHPYSSYPNTGAEGKFAPSTEPTHMLIDSTSRYFAPQRDKL